MASARTGISLAEKGRCKEALQVLKRATPHVADKQVKQKAGLAAVRCAMSLGQLDNAVWALVLLNHDFPDDPETLYVTTHAFSDLSARASMRLAATAPRSYQARELEAEALELQGKWDEAAKEYQVTMEQNPNLPGIHYRLGRLILSKPSSATTAEDAKKEFEEELKIDPNNAGAEYVLGELARQAQEWNEAIGHFSSAAKLDANFADAFLGLGFSLNSAGRYSDAVSPLETAVKLQPENPTGHFQLTIAYGRLGRKEDAEREMAIFQQTSEKALKQMHGEEPAPLQPAKPQ